MMSISNRAIALVCVVAGCSGDDAPPPSDDAGLIAADPVKTATLVAQARTLVRPGTVIQTEPRFGVPTFLWTRDSVTAPSRARWLSAAATRPEVAASRAVLADYAPLYGLHDADIANAVVANVHDRRTGPILVKLRAQVAGIEIFGEELNVVLNRKLEGVAITGYLTSTTTPPARSGGLAFQLAAQSAAAAAVSDLAKQNVDGTLVVPAGSRDGYELFALSPAAGVTLAESMRVKQVYYHLADGLEAAYYVEVLAHTGELPTGTVFDGDVPVAITEAYAYVVSAVTGEALFRKNLSADAEQSPPRESSLVGTGGFTYRVWADPVTGIPSDTPAGNANHPKVAATPDGIQAPFLAPSDVTLPNFPFSREDPWLAPGSTETVGNNVDAYINLFAPDGLGTPTAPADPATGDFRAQITGPNQFLHAQIPDGNPMLSEGRQGAIQQVFYDLNFLHDWYYDAGFDEAAGNAQTNNFGRGGVGNDSILAQTQDNTGYNNANMATGSDGLRPRMRMFAFTSKANMVDITAPATLAGHRSIGISMSGPQTFDLTADILRATFSSSPTCNVTNAAALAGKIAMFDFDINDGTGCTFSTRLFRINATSATAILMVYASATPTFVTNFIGINTSITKPVVTISFNSGIPIKTELLAATTVTARLFRAADRDGALDNQIVAHEWFHYVSNRLVGNGIGLGTQHSSGLGEGWSDFSSLLLTVRADDALTPSNGAFDGVYAIATFAASGFPHDGSANQGQYFGIRRYPYSTDMTKNPLTFKHITNNVALPVGPPVGFGADGVQNSQVHNTGEVWASMLWECYAALLRDTLGATPRLSFLQAQDRMKQYLISGLKVTSPFPTLTEARDALLAVALANDPNDYIAFRFAFAKRGAGPHAVSPDRYSVTNAGVVEDFATGPEVSFDTAALSGDAERSCDTDGVMDNGEYGLLAITLRNTGTVALSATTASITANMPELWFPAGNSLTFPAMAIGATANATLRVAFANTVVGVQQVDFTINYTDAQLTGDPHTKVVQFRTNTDEIAASSAMDNVEQPAPPWTTSFSAALGNLAPWRRIESSPLSHAWHVDDPIAGSDQSLISPVFTVDGSGSFNLQFDHTWSFEFDGGGNYDGGVIEMSVNGGGFTDIGTSAYNGTILNYSGNVNPLKGRQGFVKTNPGFPAIVHTSLTQAIAPGSTVQIRFREGSDGGIGAGGWTLDDIAFTGVVETPFATMIAETEVCDEVPTSADLAIIVTDGVTSVTAGNPVTYTITASNAGDDEIIGATVADSFPADLACTWTCVGNADGTCTGAGTGSILDRITLPAASSVTYTAACTLSASTTSVSLVNTASIALPGPVTDPVPGNNSATDIDAVIRLPAHLVASKHLSGSFAEGGSVTYTLVVRNDGTGPQLDNAGEELLDILPPGLALVSASATSGTASTAGNTVTWNGAIAAGAAVTVTINATITAAAGTTISNQATLEYDSDGDAVNDATGTTDAFPCN